MRVGAVNWLPSLLVASAASAVTCTALDVTDLSEPTAQKIKDGKRLNRRERKEVGTAEKAFYVEQRQQGADEVSNTVEATALRNYRLRNKKRRGFLQKKEASLADVLFPGVAPEEYKEKESIAVYADLVGSRKNPIPYEYSDFPHCAEPSENHFRKATQRAQKLGQPLAGTRPQSRPFYIASRSARGAPSTVQCSAAMDTQTVRWMRKLVRAQYRVQMMLDRLPVLMRNTEYNLAPSCMHKAWNREHTTSSNTSCLPSRTTRIGVV